MGSRDVLWRGGFGVAGVVVGLVIAEAWSDAPWDSWGETANGPGNVAEWAMVVLTSVAGFVAYRALRLQQDADIARDETVRRAQAARVWVTDVYGGTGGGYIEVQNGSDAPIFTVDAGWASNPTERPHGAAIDEIGATHRVIVDFQLQTGVDDSTAWVEFDDAAGVRWRRHFRGGISEK